MVKYPLNEAQSSLQQLVPLLFPTAVATISFTSVGYLDDNTCHAECTVQFW